MSRDGFLCFSAAGSRNASHVLRIDPREPQQIDVQIVGRTSMELFHGPVEGARLARLTWDPASGLPEVPTWVLVLESGGLALAGTCWNMVEMVTSNCWNSQVRRFRC